MPNDSLLIAIAADLATAVGWLDSEPDYEHEVVARLHFRVFAVELGFPTYRNPAPPYKKRFDVWRKAFRELMDIADAAMELTGSRAAAVLADVAIAMKQSHIAYRIPTNATGRIPISASLRRFIQQRDRETCRYCGRAGTAGKDPDGNSWHIDHIYPFSRGGTEDEDNLALSCRACNLSKGDRTGVYPSDFVVWPIREAG